VTQGPQPLPALRPVDERADLITEYLEKYAAIAGKDMTPQLYSIYVTVISSQPDFDLGRIQKGLKSYLETGKRWPWPADLVEAIEEQI
jgi:hypothetical protein